MASPVVTARPSRLELAALIWGLAEASVFFIVPDVLLSAIAVAGDRRGAIRACLWASGGALLGGAALYLLAAREADAVLAVIESLPAIAPAMIESARADLLRDGAAALFVGAATGVPYKIFAAQAPAAGLGLVPFLLVSLAARLGRFLAAVLIATAVDRALARWLARRARLGLLAAFWLALYALYFAVVPG